MATHGRSGLGGVGCAGRGRFDGRKENADGFVGACLQNAWSLLRFFQVSDQCQLAAQKLLVDEFVDEYEGLQQVYNLEIYAFFFVILGASTFLFRFILPILIS